MEEQLMSGKIMNIQRRTGLVFIYGTDHKKYITHLTLSGPGFKEGKKVYFYPDKPRNLFNDGKPEHLKRLFARDARRWSCLNEEEQAQISAKE